MKHSYPRKTGGRPFGADGRYAIELGVSLKRVKTAGGAVKLRSLEPYVRNLLLKRGE